MNEEEWQKLESVVGPLSEERRQVILKRIKQNENTTLDVLYQIHLARPTRSEST